MRDARRRRSAAPPTTNALPTEWAEGFLRRTDTSSRSTTIFPSLYAGRGGRPEKDAADAQEPTNTATDAGEQPVASPPVVPTNGAAPAPPNGAAQPKGQGMPGGSPIA